jgi:hypothetical protein
MSQMLYANWKPVALSGERNTYYLVYSGLENGEPVFRLNGIGEAQPVLYWTNGQLPNHTAGFFFFDTVNQANPQNGGGVLVPPVNLNSSEVPGGYGYLARGLVYLNSQSLSSSGIGGKSVVIPANMPGEPFLDIGIDLDGSGVLDTEAELELVDNRRWDLDCDDDGDVDEVDFTESLCSFDAHDVLDILYPDTYEDPTRLSNQPHEPFLNLEYPEPMAGDWITRTDYSHHGRLVNDIDGDTVADPGDRLTTLRRDRDGAILYIPANIWGVLYNEGIYTGSGNMKVYGSMLMRTEYAATGSVDVWFDEGLIKGQWPPKEFNLPRAAISSWTVD